MAPHPAWPSPHSPLPHPACPPAAGAPRGISCPRPPYPAVQVPRAPGCAGVREGQSLAPCPSPPTQAGLEPTGLGAEWVEDNTPWTCEGLGLPRPMGSGWSHVGPVAAKHSSQPSRRFHWGLACQDVGPVCLACQHMYHRELTCQNICSCACQSMYPWVLSMSQHVRRGSRSQAHECHPDTQGSLHDTLRAALRGAWRHVHRAVMWLARAWVSGACIVAPAGLEVTSAVRPAALSPRLSPSFLGLAASAGRRFPAP